MTAIIPEVLTNSASRIGSDVLHGRGLRSRRGNDDRILHRAVVSERLHDVGNRRALLPNRAIDADQVVALVVNDGVKSHCCLAGLAVSDDQFALSSPDG